MDYKNAPRTNALINQQLGRQIRLAPHTQCYDYAQRVIAHACDLEREVAELRARIVELESQPRRQVHSEK